MNGKTSQSFLDIRWSTIFKMMIGVICLYLLYLMRDIIIWFLFALIIGILFNFIIDCLDKKRIPRAVSTVILYFGVFAALGFFVYKTAPVFLAEIQKFNQNLPQYLGRISPYFETLGVEAFRSTESFTAAIQQQLGKAGQDIFNALFTIFGGALATFFIFFLAFFISLEKNFGERVLAVLAPKRYQSYLLDLWRRSKQKVSGWFISRVIGALFVGGMTYLVLTVLNVEYAFSLSLMAGILDFIPIVGPLIAGVIIALIVALSNFYQALFVLVAFFIIQLLENNLILPLTFRKFTGLPPVLVLSAFAIGAKLWGVLGAILAIPLAGVIFEVLRDYLKSKKKDISEPLKDWGQSPQNQV